MGLGPLRVLKASAKLFLFSKSLIQLEPGRRPRSEIQPPKLPQKRHTPKLCRSCQSSSSASAASDQGQGSELRRLCLEDKVAGVSGPRVWDSARTRVEVWNLINKVLEDLGRGYRTLFMSRRWALV